jgi:hypothetical protein
MNQRTQSKAKRAQPMTLHAKPRVAVGYACVSSSEAAMHGLSLDEQERAIRSCAKATGLRLVNVIRASPLIQRLDAVASHNATETT